MQNLDFFNGMSNRSCTSPYDGGNVDYFLKDSAYHSEEKHKNKPTFMLFLFLTTAILSFTGGLVVGLKYGDHSKPIVDEATQRGINNLKSKVSTTVSSTFDADRRQPVQAKNSFPANTHPFAIRISGEFDKKKSHDIAEKLSALGHTVILMPTDSAKYRVFIGPYKTRNEASNILKTLDTNEETRHLARMNVIKRS